MANTFAPNGFNQYQGTGATPTYEQVAMAIASANTTPIFAGDPVIQATGTTGVGTGYITQAPVTAPTLAISGFALSNGIVTATFTTTSAPPIGSTLVLTGLTTATTLNGAWTVLSSTTTTATFAYAGGALIELPECFGQCCTRIDIAGRSKTLCNRSKRNFLGAQLPASGYKKTH